MPATTKAKLLEISIDEFEKLSSVLKHIDASTAEKTNDEGDSIKTVIAHRAHWIDLFLSWHIAGSAGETLYLPAEGYKWNQLKKYNQISRERHLHMGWKAVLDWLEASHAKLLALIHGLSDEKLYGAPMQGTNSPWTAGRFAEANGASHYRSALKFIKMHLNSASQN